MVVTLGYLQTNGGAFSELGLTAGRMGITYTGDAGWVPVELTGC